MISNLEVTLQQVKDNYQKYISSPPNFSNAITNQNYNDLVLKNAINTSIYTIPNKYDLIWIPEINQYSIQINNLILIKRVFDKYPFWSRKKKKLHKLIVNRETRQLHFIF